MFLIDAHQDIAFNVVSLGRDVRRSALETRRLEADSTASHHGGSCMIGLPEWLSGGVGIVFGTIFVSPARPGSPDPHSYSNAAEAHSLGQAQLDYYRRLSDECEQVTLVGNQDDLAQVLASWEGESPRVGIVPLMEGADPIREPAEVEEWFERGLRLIGLSWSYGSRYAGGNAAPGKLTAAGRELLEAMAETGLTLDISHLAEESFFEAVDIFPGRIIASHVNPRARVPGPRQLSDEMIRRLLERDGVIGVVLFNGFLHPDWASGDPKEAVTLDDVVAAIDHISQIAGDAAHVGLGSDFDGGFGAEGAPAGMDTVADLERIAPALSNIGYTTDEVAAVMGGNWLRLLRETLPAG